MFKVSYPCSCEHVTWLTFRGTIMLPSIQCEICGANVPAKTIIKCTPIQINTSVIGNYLFRD